jgi:DNA-directed RNA polymerase subunit RPC12/RpoP
MSVTFNCPNCGAQLEYQGGGPSLVCQYCGNSVVVPQDLQQAQAQEEVRKMLTWPELRKNRWFQIFVAFIFITFVLPTCLGVIGALVGIGAPIFAVVLQFFLRR